MQIVILLLSLALLIVSLYAAYRGRREWILLLTLVTFVTTSLMYLFEATTVLTLFTIAGIQIHMNDMLMLILLIYIIKEFVTGVRVTASLQLTLLVLVPIVISLFRGAFAGTLGTAKFFADVRSYAYFAATLFAFYLNVSQVMNEEMLVKWKKIIDFVMNLVLVYVGVVWALDLFLGINGLPGQLNGLQSDGGSTFRIISPIQTLLIAIYTLTCIHGDLNQKRYLSIRTLLFIAVVIFMQWRTVVAAFLVGFALVLILFLVRRRGISYKFFCEIAALAGVVVVVPLITGGTGALQGMVENLFGSFLSIFEGAEGTGTFSTRLNVWGQMLGVLDGTNAIFGMPFGQSQNIAWTHSAHSGYIDWIVKTGYFGIVALMIFVVVLLVKAIRQKQSLICIVLLTITFFWIGYGFSIEQGALLGFMLGYLEKEKRMQRENTK